MILSLVAVVCYYCGENQPAKIARLQQTQPETKSYTLVNVRKHTFVM